VQERRRFVHPNDGFREQLIAFEKDELGSSSMPPEADDWPDAPPASWDITSALAEL
jgi:hypothetical protein